jgi:hypothetical protein
MLKAWTGIPGAYRTIQKASSSSLLEHFQVRAGLVRPAAMLIHKA